MTWSGMMCVYAVFGLNEAYELFCCHIDPRRHFCSVFDYGLTIQWSFRSLFKVVFDPNEGSGAQREYRVLITV